jgi:predicted nucleic acid-binding protein
MTEAGAVSRIQVLDTGVVVAFQRTGRLGLLAEIGARESLVIVEEVRDELLNVPPKHARRATDIQMALLDSERVRVESIMATEPAADVLSELRAGRSASADKGEAASIAWASARPETRLILRDKKAAMIALEELRGRVLGIFSFLMEMVVAKVVDPAAAKAAGLAMVDEPDIKERAPTWWARL